MNKQEFLKELAEELELETEVTLDTNFKDLDEWDSMGAMILIGFVSDNFDVTLNADDIKELTTFQSIIEKIGQEKFD
ncbi:acyl carrier protein [Mesoflavibacter sabulilitoris]|uniref:Acyl carrier protein n=1 Tax=Mesoflavibacter zeaxanthinifaciens subsp. sabulilitoris TaxID=1520893 RepID=A0A2T1N6G3_9FLAO|nr:acyl carrier protein [Mesoflavibacter zeaxanthinifaciens]MBB3123183.1 acyl carrier protein [Mesoflavibacter zeaxanthinifaciens subsp. sabulilitoris]PSG87178.1 acyl carrier protein [Mesoflavibacter zeaxanthinifaciens subsp. sabulilitoris]